MMTKTLCMTGATWFLVCAFASPAFAGDDNRNIPLFSDQRGNKAWVQVESTAGRTKATPFVAVGGEDARKGARKLEATEKTAIPLPAIMRFVEHARQALRGATRSAPQGEPTHAGAPATLETAAPRQAEAAGPPAGDPLEAAPTPSATDARPNETASPPAASFRPPERIGTPLHPPVAMYSPAGS